jgi:hypothetical protein
MKMGEEFEDWLNQCPVQWVRIAGFDYKEHVTYKFYAPDNEEESNYV